MDARSLSGRGPKVGELIVVTLFVGALVVTGYGFGYQLYQKRQTRESIRRYLNDLDQDEWRR